MNDDAENELLRGIGEGDPGALQTLVDHKLPRILALARRVLGDLAEAEDIAQETLVRAWRQAPRWTPGGASFDSWMHKVALNLCHDRLRRRRETLMANPPDAIDPGARPDGRLLAASIGVRIDAALLTLPPRQREAIILCHYQELSNIEAAEIMNVSVEALESLLSRARRALRTSLADLMA